MCPSSCAPRESHFSISQICAPPPVPRGNHISPFLKYVPLLLCPAGITFLHFSNMCPSSCAPRESNFSISQICAPPPVPRGNQISPFLKYVPLLLCPAGIKFLRFSNMCPSSCAPRESNFSVSQ